MANYIPNPTVNTTWVANQTKVTASKLNTENTQLYANDNALDTQVKTNADAIAAIGTDQMSASTYDPAGITEQLVGLTAIQSLTNKTFDSSNTFPSLTSSQIASLSTASISSLGTESIPALQSNQVISITPQQIAQTVLNTNEISVLTTAQIDALTTSALVAIDDGSVKELAEVTTLISQLAGGGGGWEWVSTKSLSGLTTADFENQVAGYDYLYRLADVLPSDDASNIKAQVGVAGVTYRTTNYTCDLNGMNNGTPNYTSATTLHEMSVSAQGNLTAEFAVGHLEVTDPMNSGTKTVMDSSILFRRYLAGEVSQWNSRTRYNTAEAHVATRFKLNGGTFSTGKIFQYRRANS